MSNRLVVLDTETTGLEHNNGDRVIEIGCVEIIDRRLTGRHYHRYINPGDRKVGAGAVEIHGITDAFLADKPLFEQIVDEFLGFVDGAELIIHNAPFDVGFLNAELLLLGRSDSLIEQRCSITDTLVMARQMHPGQSNKLDALCGRYGVDNSNRELHGALLDAEILADVYLAMTGGQTALALGAGDGSVGSSNAEPLRRLSAERKPLPVIVASDDEKAAHREMVAAIQKASGQCLWEPDPG